MPEMGRDASKRNDTLVTIVTGASEGLGRALAREFAAAGHTLLLVARSKGRLEEAAGRIDRDFGVAAHIHAADLTAAQGCASVEEAVREKALLCDYLVNNAGFGLCGDFAQADQDRLMALTDLNIRALTDLTRRFLPGMIARGSGGVLNVASLAGFLPGPFQAAYYASKAYVISLTEALAEEARGTGVRVAALAPGPVKTAFHERMGGESAGYIRFQGLMRAETVAKIGYTNFMCGQKIIVPGAINMASAAAVRYLPHMLVTPLVARLLLKPGDKQSDA